MKILHTADWQIGMRVRQAGRGAASVREQRIASAEALAAVAREHRVDAVFVAGDVFEDNAVERADVQRVVDACTSFGVPTYVLPGNHDPLVTGSVWDHASWAGAAHVHVLRSAAPVEMAPGVTLYPCPAFTKMSSIDPTMWIADASAEGTRIGIAHGTVVGATVSEDCYPIRRDAASALGLDYLALGHWHSTAFYDGDPTGARMAYSGTHETTKFGERDSGNVLIVDVPGRNAMPKLTSVATGSLRWYQLERDIREAVDLDAVIHEVEAISDPARSLFELRLRGVVHPSDLREVERLRDLVAARFPVLGRFDDSGLMPAPGDDAWTDALPAGLLREVAREIRSGPADEATGALLLLYRYGTEAGEVAA